MDEGPSADDHELDVRILRVVGPNGEEQHRQTVYCPRREVSLRVDVCTSCDHFRGVRLKRDGQSELGCVEAPPRELTSTPARLTPVSRIMIRSLVAIERHAKLSEVARTFERTDGFLPVVDEGKRPVGWITHQSLRRRRRLRGPEPTAERLMEPSSPSLAEGVSVGHASALMADRGERVLSVVDEEGRLVGLITALDVLAWLARREGFLVTGRP